VLDTENGRQKDENTENTEPTARNTTNGFIFVYLFLNITSISI
jgi:hypothetical protein